ncbi:lipoxygenase homology domain-containing protein 1-like isoform X2 [Branchiostoma lanceolatum]|uniref:lipoxygenase homology domain-containing protein 1-like isoform X2 n=1 Tax=Branchiostoma lanceolatum TaxID=7740 RepID=UPI003456081B
MNRSPPTQPPMAPPREPGQQPLSEGERCKNVYFCKSGDHHFSACKVPISRKNFRTFDALLTHLSRRVPLPFGVRSIHTPGGIHGVSTIEQLEDGKAYVCSDRKGRAKPVDLSLVSRRPPPWHHSKPDSAKRRALLLSPTRKRVSKTSSNASTVSNNLTVRTPKKILVMKNGDPQLKHVFLLNRRTAQNFENVLDDIAQVLRIAVQKLFTVEGKKVDSLQGVFSGPDVFVAAGREGFKPMNGPVAYVPHPPNKPPRDRESRATRETDKRSPLKPTEPKKSKGRFRVWVHTGDYPNSGTDAHVTLTVYGDRNNSGPLSLGGGDGMLFERGNEDEFTLSAGNIGEVYKIRIGHDDSGASPAWYCREIHMEDMNTKDQFQFPVERWMARDEDDGEVCRELPIYRDGEPILPIMKYQCAVYTGDVWNAGTDANVYITVYGERGDTGPRLLHKGKKAILFEKGQVDVFYVEAVHLGNIKKVIIGHDGTGLGAGWFLDKVVMKESKGASREFVFPCERWLDEGEDDGKIVRELLVEDQPMTRNFKEKEMWELEKWKFQKGNHIVLFSKATHKSVRIKTDASVDAYGDPRDNYGVFEVVKRKNNVRVFSSVPNPAYHLAVDQNRVLGQLLEDNSLAPNEVDSSDFDHESLMSKSAATSPELRYSAISDSYMVEYPDEDQGTPTPEDIPIVMDQKGQLFAEDLKPPQVLRRAKTPVPPGDRSLRPESPMPPVLSPPPPDKSVPFPPPKPPPIKQTSSGGKRLRRLHRFSLPKNDSASQLQVLSLSQCKSNSGNVPKAQKLVKTRRWSTEPHGKSKRFSKQESWSTKSTSTEPRSSDSDLTSFLPMLPGKGGAFCEFQVKVQVDRCIMLESVKYPSQHMTFMPNGKAADTRGTNTGPGRQFSVYVKGVFRDDGIIRLNSSNSQCFAIMEDGQCTGVAKRNQEANFRVIKVQDGGVRMFESLEFPNRFLRIKDGQCDGFGIGDRYCHFQLAKHHSEGYVTLESVKSRGVYVGIQADGKARPCVDTGEPNIKFYPEVIKFGKKKERSPSTPESSVVSPVKDLTPPQSPVKKIRTPHNSPSPSPPVTPDDTPRQKTPEEDNVEAGDWQVWVITGKESTDAQVTLEVFGDQGVSGPIVLGRGGQSGMFEALHEDTFQVNLSDVGDIYKIRVSHDNTGDKPDWYLGKVHMKDLNGDEELVFKFHRWLSRHKDDGDILRELPVVQPGKKTLPVLRYHIQVYTGDIEEAFTEGDIYMNIVGERGDTGERLLLNSTQEKKFQPGQVDVFEIEAVSLGALKSVVLRCDSGRSDTGWYCQQVVVREAEGARTEWIFPYERHPEEKRADGQLVRTLPLKEERPVPSDSAEDSYEEQAKKIVEVVLQKSVKALTNPGQQYDDADSDFAPESNSERDREADTNTDSLSETEPEQGDWKVYVSTGSMEDAGTDAEVTLFVYGDEKCSEPIQLGLGKDGLFQQHTADKFKVNVKGVGDIYKVRIGHNNEGERPDWYLERLKMKDLNDYQVLNFVFNRWLSHSRDDGDTWRELPVVKPGVEPLPVLTYQVAVYTGAESDASFTSNLRLTIHGSRGDTGCRLLHRPLNHTHANFQPGQMDLFAVEAVSLDRLKKVVIALENESGDGVFLDKVVIKESAESSREHVFICNQWLHKDKGDGQTERELSLEGEDWKVWVTTATDSKSAHGSQAALVIYGDKGKSEELVLANEETKCFEPGATNEFQISTADLGDIYKIRVGYEDEDKWEGWHLKQVKLQAQSSGEEFLFKFDRWLSRTEDDYDIVREMAITKDSHSVLPVLQYYVSVYTGDHWGAHTDADVFITLYGERGDSGRRRLFHSTTNAVKFGKKQVDTFLMEAVSLGQLNKVIIGHDGVGYGAGLYVDAVTVHEGESAVSEWFFPCGHWLDDHMEDSCTERELSLLGLRPVEAIDELQRLSSSEENKKSNGNFTVYLRTSDSVGTGTRAKVWLTVYGETGNSGPINLGTDQDNGKYSQPGKEVVFDIKAGEIGELTKIRVELEPESQPTTWHLNAVLLHDQDTGEDLTFHCDCPLSDDPDTGSLQKEVPVLRASKMPLPVLQYYVMVHTGDVEGAETAGNVYLCIYGNKGDTGKRQLHKSLTNAIPFLRKQVDVFMFEAVSVGDIEVLKVGHDADKPGEGWFVSKVVVKESEYARTEAVFTTECWLDAQKEDGRLEREIPLEVVQPASPNPKHQKDGDKEEKEEVSQGTWDVWVTTGSDQDCGTAAKVQLVVYGEQGNTEPIALNKKFEAGTTRKLEITVGDIGEIYKIRLSHDGTGTKQAWFIEKIKMKDSHTRQEFLFTPCTWLSDQSEQGAMIELPAIRPDIPPLQERTYEVSVYTGDEPAGGTEARVYFTIFGDHGDTGRRILTHSINNTDKFQQGQVDVFHVTALDVGKPKYINIGHDNLGRGAGWFLDRVTVKESSEATSEYIFPCSRWLDSSMEDGKTVRTLRLLGEVNDDDNTREKDSVTEGEWKCWVTTSNVPAAGTDSKVYIKVFGENGVSDDILLNNSDKNFQRGQMDEFDLHLGRDLGEIYKLRVWHDGKTSWHLQQVKLLDMHTNEELKFDFDCRLVSEGQEGSMVRELPAIRPGKDILPLVNYNVSIISKPCEGNSGGGPQFSINLVGERGDTGVRPLLASPEVDVHHVEAVSLGKLHRVVLRKGPSYPLYVTKVVVKEGDFAKTETVFQHEGFVGDHDRPQDEAEQELTVSEVAVCTPPERRAKEEIQTQGEWQVWCTTNEHANAGTRATVHLVVYGDRGDSGLLTLQNGDQDCFSSGRTSEFKVNVGSIGDIYKIRIGHDNTKEYPGWFLEKIRLKDVHTLAEFSSQPRRWLATDSSNGDVWMEIPTVWPGEDTLPVLKYQVEVHTSDLFSAGTDSNVYIAIYGQRGDTGKRELVRSQNNDMKFEQGQTDLFEVEAVSLGELQKVVIGHDGHGLGSGWHLDNVVVKESPDTEYTFPCNRWLDENEDDKLTERELVLQEDNPAKSPDHAQATPPPEDTTDNKKDEWTVCVTTSEDVNAGTDAQVTLTVYGDKGNSGPLQLGVGQSGFFERGKIDEFDVRVGDVGKIYKIRLEQDNSGTDPGWKVHKVELSHPSSGETLVFTCERWLATNQDDGQTCRELPAVREGEETLPVHRYQVGVRTGDAEEASTDSNVYMTMYGKRGDTGKRQLVNKLNDHTPFQRGKVDLFEVEAVSLSDLTKIVISHDDSRSDWFLDKVIIKESPQSKESFQFISNSWLSKDREDGQLEREVPVEKQDYIVKVYTGDKFGAGTDSTVHMVIHGSNGASTRLKLLNNMEDHNKFESGGVDTFQVETLPVGIPERIVIGHDGKGRGSGWYLDKVIIKESEATDKEFVFQCDRWLDEDEDDGKTERQLEEEGYKHRDDAADGEADRPRDNTATGDNKKEDENANASSNPGKQKTPAATEKFWHDIYHVGKGTG